MTAIAPPQPQIIYPSSDGEPVAETYDRSLANCQVIPHQKVKLI
jgi:hypothetical protein